MKKLIVILGLTLILLLGTASASEIDDIAAAEIHSTQAENGFNITVTSAEELNAVLITLVCDAKTGVIKGFAYHELTLDAGENAEVFAACDFEAECIKVLLWDGITTLRPLLPTVELKYEEPSPEKPKPVSIPLSARNVWSTDRQNNNGIDKLFDGNASTYMAGRALSGKPVVISAELDGIYELSELAVGFTNDPARVYSFDAEASIDGDNYFNILSKTSSDTSTSAPMGFEVQGRAKYVRVRVFGYGGNDDGWCRVNHFSLKGTLDSESHQALMFDDFESLSDRLPSSKGDSRWFAYAIDEETYNDYTPSTGNNLYAGYEAAPEDAAMGKALHIHDAADRDGGTGGQGGIAAFRALEIPADGLDYTVSFRLFIDADSANINWAGISLLSTPVTGGADLTAAAALQLRLSPGSIGRAAINVLDSVQYNEGHFRQAFNSEFALGTPWDVTLKVSPRNKRTEVTIDDGTTRESRIFGYNYTDVERVNNQTWSNALVQYISFNSGVGGMLDMYVDDFALYADAKAAAEEKVIYHQAFESISSPSDAGIQQAVVWKNADGSTGGGSIGGSLQATVAASGTFGSRVLKLTDNDKTDGLMVGVPLTIPDNDNIYIIKWRMRDFEPNNYSGVSLSSGFNRGKSDTDHPIAVQLRYSMQDSNSRIQFNSYPSIRFNDDGVSYGGFLATGGTRLRAGRNDSLSALNFEITVYPLSKTMDIVVSDDSGTTVSTTHAFETYGSYGGNEDWSGKRVDTLLFNTAGGGISDCIVDDIQVIDTGIGDVLSTDAVHGIVRLEAAWGKGKFLTDDGSDRPKAVADVDPNRTRFAERLGLIGNGGISLESVDSPGYYLSAVEVSDTGGNDVNHVYELALLPYEDTAQFRAMSTFIKLNAENTGDYTGTCVSYAPIFDTERRIGYTNTSTNPLRVIISDSDYTYNELFYLRSEAVNYVSDNFKGTSLNSQWWTNYPWKSNNPTNDSYNFTALIDHRNVIVENGELLLKATKINSNEWPTDLSGETGISYNGDYGKNWLKWAGRVGVVSSQKVFYRQSLISGSFKQPESPIGYWNAFWLRNSSGGWNRETDIFEYLSSRGSDTWYTAVHRIDSGSEKGYGAWQNEGLNLRSGYHEFTLDWGYNYMKFYVDGKLYVPKKDGKGPSTDDINRQNEGLQLIMNTGIGGWESEPDSNMIWNDGMRVQWIRSFRY